MKIGIFGGAFNPPHTGHVQAAKRAAIEQKLDLLIIIPTGTPSHKALPQGTPKPEIRFLMTQNAFSGMPDVLVSDMEIHSTDNNYTIDTVASLRGEYPGADFFLLVGTDMYDSLSTWKDSESLVSAVTPVLLSRDMIDISSTELRKMLPRRGGAGFISPSNYEFIIRHRYYGAKPDWDWLRARAHSMLDPERIPHVDACESAAILLAERWNVDPDDAREAAILHDITKKLDFRENMCIIAEHTVVVGDLGGNEAKLLHSITGALLAETEFGVSKAVSNAIRWHTTGRAGMSVLEKVIYIADYIESTRDFPGVDKLRQKAFGNIDDAMIMGLEMTIGSLMARGITPTAATYDALNDLVSQH